MPRKSALSYETCDSIFARKLTKAMEMRGENQTTLSKKITEQYVKIQRQTISLYMNGQSKPDTERLAAIAKVLNVSSDWLLGLTDDSPTINYSARKISEITGISVEIIEYFIYRKQHCKHPSDNNMTVFNMVFTPDELNDLLRTIVILLLDLQSGNTALLTAQSQLEKLQQMDVSEAYEQANMWKDILAGAKKQIRLARFDSVDSFTTALDAAFDNPELLKRIDSLIDAYAGITDIVDQDMIDTAREYEERENNKTAPSATNTEDGYRAEDKV